MTFSVPEKFRIRTGRVGSDASFGNNGAFEVRLRHAQTVYVIASDGAGWEHVSVSRRDRCPTWDEMCQDYIAHLKLVGECVTFDGDSGDELVVLLGDYTMESLA